MFVGQYLFSWQFVKVTRPNESCMQILDFLKNSNYKTMANEAVIFLDAILSYSVCYKYVTTSEYLANVGKVSVVKSSKTVEQSNQNYENSSEEEDLPLNASVSVDYILA
jgi:hypothetical protein